MNRRTLPLSEPLSWQRGMKLLRTETDYGKRGEIVKSMQRHRVFRAEVIAIVERAKKERRQRK